MNKEIPKVSIVLPTYNGTQYIKESIDSCLEQSYKSLELIIVDDGSTNNIKRIIDSYNDERIIYLRHKTNLGLANALNTGFSHARGVYLTWTSDDNLYKRKAIEAMVRVLENNPKIDFVYANYYIINAEGQVTQYVSTGRTQDLDRHNCIGPCFLYRRRVYKAIGMYNPRYFLAEDYEYWLRIRDRFNMSKIDDFLYFYREHNDRLSSTHEAITIEKQVEKAIQGHVPIWSIYYHEGRICLLKKKRMQAVNLFIKSLLLNPLNGFIWLMVFFSFINLLNPPLAQRLKSFKNNHINKPRALKNKSISN